MTSREASRIRLRITRLEARVSSHHRGHLGYLQYIKTTAKRGNGEAERSSRRTRIGLSPQRSESLSHPRRGQAQYSHAWKRPRDGRAERDSPISATEARNTELELFSRRRRASDPFIDVQKELYNSITHEGCVRSLDCEQAMVLIRKGLDLSKRDWVYWRTMPI